MVGHDFKTPGLIRAGFQYQDLVAIEILINFLQTPGPLRLGATRR